jgi:hypothetical protein
MTARPAAQLTTWEAALLERGCDLSRSRRRCVFKWQSLNQNAQVYPARHRRWAPKVRGCLARPVPCEAARYLNVRKGHWSGELSEALQRRVPIAKISHAQPFSDCHFESAAYTDIIRGGDHKLASCTLGRSRTSSASWNLERTWRACNTRHLVELAG